MKCEKCNRDRELGVNLFGHFFCTNCTSDTIDSLAAAGIAEYVDNSVDIENFSVEEAQHRLNAATVAGALPGDEEGDCPYTGTPCEGKFDDECESCGERDTCKEGTSEAPDFTPPCGGEFIP